MDISKDPTTGAILRRRRQELGLTLQTVAERTRIRRGYLEALEQDQADVFPGNAYREGFLRTYAGVLGLKVDDLPERKPQRYSPPLKESPPSRVSPPRSAAKGLAAFAVAGLLVAAAIMSASFFRNSLDSAPQAQPSVSTEAEFTAASAVSVEALPQAGEADEAATVIEGGSAAVEPSNPPEASTFTASPEEPEGGIPMAEPPARFLPAEVMAEGPAPQEQDLAPQRQAFSGPAPPTETVIEAVGDPFVNVIRLQAVGETQVELVLDNRPPQRYDVKAGTHLSWRVVRSALLRVSDPSAVELSFGDRPLDLRGKNQILLQSQTSRSSESL